MKKILIVGASGLLGARLYQTVKENYEVYGTFVGHELKGKNFFKLDVTNRKETFKLMGKVKPSVVFDLHSITDVDYCELHPEEAWTVNVEGTKNVAEACKTYGAKMVFISSVTGNTPILVRINGEIGLLSIEKIMNKSDVEVLCLDEDYKLSFKKIEKVVKHLHNKIYHIHYEGGGKISTSSSHSVFIFDKNGIKEKRVEELKVGDLLVTALGNVSNLVRESKIFDVNELLKDEEVKPIKTFLLRKTLFENLLKRPLKLKDITNDLGMSFETLKWMISEGYVGWNREEKYYFITEKGKREYLEGMSTISLAIKRKYHNLKEINKIKITKELMWLLGLYLAEGHASHTKKEIARGLRKITIASKNLRILKKAKEILEKQLNYRNAVIRERRDIFHLELGGKILHKIFSSFKCTSKTKKIPNWVWYQPRELIISLLKGYRGDAHVKKNKETIYSSINKNLIIQLLWLCRINNIACRYEEKIIKNVKGVFQKRDPYNQKIYSFVIPSYEISKKFKHRAPSCRCLPKWYFTSLRRKTKDRHFYEPKPLHVSKEKLRKIFNLTDISPEEMKLIESGIGIARVRKIEIEEKKIDMYDIHVPNIQNFFGGNVPILLHNTDYVFDGTKSSYSEKDKPKPLNYYGKTKAIAEKVIQLLGVDNIIVRTAVLYGIGGYGKKPFPLWVLENLKERKEIKVVVDQSNNPTLADDLAKILSMLYEKDFFGLFHAVGKDNVSRYEFALKVAEVFNLNKNLIKPIVTPELRQVALRPRKLELSTKKLQRVLGIVPLGVEDGLGILKKQLEMKS
jgi:dTDP-4-dehydrorhamnose reductase/intein/homing endonuclease